MNENFVLVRIVNELDPVILSDEESIWVSYRFEDIMGRLIQSQAVSSNIDIWLLEPKQHFSVDRVSYIERPNDVYDLADFIKLLVYDLVFQVPIWFQPFQ